MNSKWSEIFAHQCPSFTQPGGECGTVLYDMTPPIIEPAHQSCMPYDHPIFKVIFFSPITIVGDMDSSCRGLPMVGVFWVCDESST
jgi:hypothetical protein